MNMRRLLIIVAVVLVPLATSTLLCLVQAKQKSMQNRSTGSAYKQEDLMARYTRDRMFYQAGEIGEINLLDKTRHFKILKKVLADYPQSSFAPAWQLAIATETNELEDFQKLVQGYPGNHFICAIAYTKIGEICRSRGENEKAKESFQKALSLIDECIMNEPRNAAYNYHKAIIKIKETGETFDWDREKGYPPDGRLMHPDIFSELRKGNKKDHYSAPFLEVEVLIDLYKSTREIVRRLKAQGDYYEKQGDIDKVIESYETMLKIGKHFQEDNQTLAMETLGLSIESMMHTSLKKLFEKHGMMERKEKLEKASKILEERKHKIGLLNNLEGVYLKVIVNKGLSDLPSEAQADSEKAIREVKEEAVDTIEKNNLIKDKNLEARIFISYLLSKLGGEKTIAILKKGLNDKEPYVRFFVKKILEEH